MTMWSMNNICRVCSSPAEYSLSKVIPSYLHENTNEYLQWQKPMNVLLEEATGLKVSSDDGLPHQICALCISYLKHAVTFREQTICNTMNLKTLQLIREKLAKDEIMKQKSVDDKDNLLVTAEDLHESEGHKIDMNLLTNNCKQIQDKVCKQLLTHITAGMVNPEDVNKHVQNLSLVNGKSIGSGSGQYGSSRNMINVKNYDRHMGDIEDSGSESDDESKSNLTSESIEDEEDITVLDKDILSYKEKCFEEDDIMDCDALRDIVSFKSVENFKERKCPACARRFMFTDSYNAHTAQCFEYAFLIFTEDINRLLKVRRKKAVSPHEFIRRMIFRFRKMSEWLKANTDEALPDISEECDKQRLDSYAKSSESSKNNEESTYEGLNLEKPKLTNNAYDKLTVDDLLLNTTNMNKEYDGNMSNVSLTKVFDTPKGRGDLRPPPTIGTPINISNNILYEIERSLSRNSANHQMSRGQTKTSDGEEGSPSAELKRPIPILGTRTAPPVESNENPFRLTQTTATHSPQTEHDIDRLTFLQKLQKACHTPPSGAEKDEQFHMSTKAATPQIAVRKDLLPVPDDQASEMTELPITMALKFVARCNACGILFQSLAALEVHNAAHHNTNSQ